MINDIVNLYERREDTTCLPKLSYAEAHRYFLRVYTEGLISTVYSNDTLTGYVEHWRITFEQFGKLICNAPFCIYEEDLDTGPLAFVRDIYILPEYRQRSAIQELKYKYWIANKHCDYFCGQALRKRTQPVKVFKKQQAYEKWAKKIMEVPTNGR